MFPSTFFTIELSESPPWIFLSNTANLKTVEFIAYQWAAKNWSPIWPRKKIFFSSFSCWDDLTVNLKTDEIFFFKKITFQNFGEISLQFFVTYWSAFNYTVLRIALFDIKINCSYFDSSRNRDAPAPRGLYLCRHQWVKRNLSKEKKY